ncbi:MAG: YicC family protein [Candidatus Hydrogenedentota bacterium]
MTHSMTGFGKATSTLDGQSITVEVSAVNHRYLDCSLRMPSSWMALDPVLKETVRQRVSRGKYTINISRRRVSGSDSTVGFDAVLAKQYLEASRQIGQLLGTFENLSLDTLVNLEGVLYQAESEEDLSALESALVGTLNAALDALIIMRTREGLKLENDIRERVSGIRASLERIEARLPELSQFYEERLRARIGELAMDVSLKEERIALEVALMAEKSDVNEEVVRLKTHLEHLESILAESEPVGRRLDFLTQEIQREINTLGVKTRDAGVAKDILDMKAELERIREQIQNIE